VNLLDPCDHCLEKRPGNFRVIINKLPKLGLDKELTPQVRHGNHGCRAGPTGDKRHFPEVIAGTQNLRTPSFDLDARLSLANNEKTLTSSAFGSNCSSSFKGVLVHRLRQTRSFSAREL